VATARIGNQSASADQERRRPSAWSWLVGASVVVLVAAGAALGALWLATLHTRTDSFSVAARLREVQVDIGSGSVDVSDGGNGPVRVHSAQHYAFGRAPQLSHGVRDGVLHVTANCPHILVGHCAVDYRLAVPSSIPVVVKTGDGDVRFDAFRGTANVITADGNVGVAAYCGRSLTATSANGDVSVTAVCPPARLALRSGTGNVTVAVPPNRYRVTTASGNGSVRVTGIITDRRAASEILAESGDGDVRVGAAP
jgi:hypothetical protein